MSFRRNLRLRGVLLVVGAVAALWLIAAAMTWRAAEHEAAEIFDGHLAQAASMLIAQTALEIEDPEELEDEGHAPLTHRYARKVAFQVWETHKKDKDGRKGGARGETLLVHSANAPSVRLGDVEEGFSDSVIDGQTWRVFSAWNADRELLVQVGERAEARQDMADQIAFGLLMPLLWALPLLALLVWWAVAQALQPLSALGEQIARRSPDRLDPLPADVVPDEVQPLVDRLNALLQRVAVALDSEKRFTGDAAHELRTPIAALSAQAQVALAENDPTRRAQALQAVLVAADRMSRLVEQLLTLARADSALAADWPETDLAALAREVVGELAPAALARTVELELDAPESVMLRGERTWLAILLRNLIDNAVRHSPPSGVVRVFLRPQEVPVGRPQEVPVAGIEDTVAGEGLWLTVSDQGPGVPETLLGQLGRRFWRREGETDSGSGLGLSIVRRIAELHHAELSFSRLPEGGLRARIDFPAV